MRVATTVLFMTLIVLTGCGGSRETASTASLHPYASLTVPTHRILEIGERITLACGVSLTVPDGYDGSIACFPAQMPGQYDVVQSQQFPPASLMGGFSAESLPPDSPQLERFATSSVPLDGQPTQSPPRWPVIAGSAEEGVEVRLATTPAGRPDTMEIIAVIIRTEGMPAGLITVTVYGEAATNDPVAAMAQLETIWDQFSIGGASLPSVAQ